MEQMICGFGHAPEIYSNDPNILKVSPSAIMEFLKSPAHYHAKYIRGISKKTKAMEQGTQVHMAILESEKFFDSYCREPNKSDFPNSLGTMDDWKAVAKVLGLKVSGSKDELKQRVIEADPKTKELDWDFIVAHATKGKQIISESDWTAINELKMSLEYNQRLKTLFKRPGWREQLAWIFDDENKILYKFKTDFVDETGIIVDIKKTPAADMKSLSRKIYYENLYVQAAMYFDFWMILHQHFPAGEIPKPRAFVFAAFEMESPYIWQDYALDAGAMDAGAQRYKKAILSLMTCRADNIWPTYQKKLVPVTLPHFAWDELDRLAEDEIDVEFK